MTTEMIIPGKAYEIAAADRKLDTDLRLKLKGAQKKKKGRGYRVFVNLEQKDIQTLAEYFGTMNTRSLSLVDAQAVRNATERFVAASGVEVERPSSGGKGAHMRDATADAIWSVIAPVAEMRNCKCQLRKGMTLEELKALGAGCTDPHDLKYKILKMPKPQDRKTRIMSVDYPGYVCPTLGSYRNAVRKLSSGQKTDNNNE